MHYTSFLLNNCMNSLHSANKALNIKRWYFKITMVTHLYFYVVNTWVIYNTAQVQSHNRCFCELICLRWVDRWLRGLGIYFACEFSSCNKQGKYLQLHAKEISATPLNRQSPNRISLASATLHFSSIVYKYDIQLGNIHCTSSKSISRYFIRIDIEHTGKPKYWKIPAYILKHVYQVTILLCRAFIQCKTVLFLIFGNVCTYVTECVKVFICTNQILW